ncbi:peptide ABC transporter substrate-binding protein [Geosporobacter ferrireducens]|uniref:peptide ABC transporter substrate-binding protein n=1 Tax=Geosporobacter ferrireducens TaxID=1424294 RepID=UPI00139BE9EE|nr:peptide ABC transporter substrate-binding protein [Geosporobacter ferrireducens]MTI55943.1 peptide ABC transporter substrate-binding protein [Geosporobacter ferrireducens]
MKRKTVLVLLLVVMMILSLIGCGGSQTPADNSDQDETTSTEKILTYSVLIDMPTLDQSLANSADSMTLISQIQEGLVRLHDGKVIPGIAKEWEVSEDGLVYTFHLRDVKWSDGVNITAYDFEYAVKRLVDPATASPYSFIAEPIKNAMKVNAGELGVEETGVKALDEKTLEITLEIPAPYFLGILNMPHFHGVRKDLVEKFGQDFAADPDKNVYSGPFVLEEWKHEDRLMLVKNQSYWDKDKVNLDKVNVIVVPDPNTALSMFENGDLDFVDVPPNLVEQYLDKAQLYYNGADDFLKLNMDGKNPLKNKNLRLAVNYAIDRDDYINITTSGLFDAGTRYVLPVVAGVDKKYGEEYPYEAFPLKADTNTAKDYLDKAIKELGVSNPQEIKLELLTTDTDVSRIQAEVLQDQIQRNLGIIVNIKQVPYKQRLQMETNREFQMVFSGWAPDYDDPHTYLCLWTTHSPYNQISYSNAKYDELLDFSSTCRDPRERMDALFAAEKVLLEDGAIVPLQMRRVAWLMHPKVKGLVKSYVGPREDYIYADIEE